MAGSGQRLRMAVLAATDALTYALVLTVVVLVLSLLASISTGGRLARANVFLFVTGWLLMAYSTFRLWPSKDELSEEKTSTGRAVPAEHGSRFQALVRAMPPGRWVPLPPPEDRIPQPGQLFIASIVVLLTSFAFEKLIILA